MADRPLAAGKLPTDVLAAILHALPPMPGDVIVGPAVGEDACAIQVPEGTLVAATDPITFTGSIAGRLAVIVNANDVAVMGARPRWFLCCVLMPMGSTAQQVQQLFAELTSTLSTVGAALVGGHTEVTSVVSQPVVVGQMLGWVETGRLLKTSDIGAGDVVVQVGSVPVEAAAVLSAEPAVADAIDPLTLAAAISALDSPGTSVVDAALLAGTLGAVAMHDVTEGGLAGALHELAAGCGHALIVDAEAVRWFEPGLAIARALGLDPWAMLGSGALLAAFSSQDAGPAVDRLRAEGYEASPLASVSEGEGVSDRRGQIVPRPE